MLKKMTIFAAIVFAGMSVVFLLISSGNLKYKKAVEVVQFDEKEEVQTEVVEEKKLTDVQGWALGCSAILIERNHGRHDTLNPRARTENNVKEMKEMLEEWWGIENREDLLESLEGLEEGGHRERFAEIGDFVCSIPQEQYDYYIRTTASEDVVHKMIFAKEYYEKLGDKSILSWDYCRYICLCRWGYGIGYLTEEEAWARIIPAAKMLQEKFDSWKELGQNYIIGRNFWSYKYSKEEGYLFEDALHRLIDMASSPWNIYPWDMSLDEPDEQYLSKEN